MNTPSKKSKTSSAQQTAAAPALEDVAAPVTAGPTAAAGTAETPTHLDLLGNPIKPSPFFKPSKGIL